jgi:hypothetical protein
MALVDTRNVGQIAMDEINSTEREMAMMFKELNDLEDQIKGNVDLQ